MTTQSFSATEEELDLATHILISRGCNGEDGVLQGDQAKEVFNRSALPVVTLRVVWNMSSENGNGVLSKHELAKALRLIGWVQAGEMLDEKLLGVAGPLPTLDGITNTELQSSWKGPSPQISVSPAVNEDQVREFKSVFWQAGPVNGFLTEDQIMNVYMTSDLSYENIRDIINLIDRSSRRVVDFTEFACGLYLVKALQSSQLHSLPTTIPPDLFEQFKDPSSSVSPSQPPPQPAYRPVSTYRQSYLALSPVQSRPRVPSRPSPSDQLSPSMNSQSNVETDDSEISHHDRNMFELYFRKLDGDNKGHLKREAFDEFVSVYRVPAADLDRIWGLTTLDRNGFMKRDEFIIAMYLVKQRSAGEEIPASLPLAILSPSLRSRRHTVAASSLSQKISIKKPPPPVPPKKRDALMKAASFAASTIVSVSPPPKSPPPVPRLAPTNPFRQSIALSSLPKSPISPPKKSPFDDPMTHSQSLPVVVNDIPRPPSPPSPSPPIANHHHVEEPPDKSKDEISRLSGQIEELLGQLGAQNELRAANDALRLENDTYKLQVKDMERMMADILAVNESESVGSQEKYTQDITQIMSELAEKEAHCEDQERRLRTLSEEEKELRMKLRELDAAIARHVADAQEYRQTIDLQKQRIEESNARVADMSKALADEPESNRNGTTSNRELRVVIRDVTRENERLKSEVRDMHRSMEQLLLSTKHAKHDAMELENRKLKKSVSELEIMVTQLQTSVGLSSSSRPQNAEALVRENEQLKSQLQDGKRSFADFRSSSETRMVGLQQKIEELTQENNRLRMDMHEASEGRSREDGSVPPPAYDETFVPPQ